MIDLHTHVLPGLDDGPETIEQSLELLRAAQADGIRRVAATPHVRDDYPTTAEQMELLVAEVSAAAAREGIPVVVLPGAEIDLAALAGLDDETLRRFGLGGNPRLLLLEFPYRGWPLGLREQVFQLAARGFTVVLAHPERNREVQRDPAKLVPLVEGGVLVQLTAASLDGRLGKRSRTAAQDLLSAGLAHLLASDAHAASVRATGLSAAAESIRFPELVRWLTEDVPDALLRDAPLPPRPERRRSPRLLTPWRA
ncbi:MAG TPA: CpsB/CapC family capsule biosynthesis tyrosine phosphatase [Gaiellaceae bacterium]|nr:CpsB/CapC family capsule biosynthesis tyrosine phosphatase [Gaiellaceae bacterium]